MTKEIICAYKTNKVDADNKMLYNSPERERHEQITKLASELLVKHNLHLSIAGSDDKEDVAYTVSVFEGAWKSAERFFDFCAFKIKVEDELCEELNKAFSDAPTKVFDRDDTTDESEVLGYCSCCGKTVSKEGGGYASLSKEVLYCSESCITNRRVKRECQPYLDIELYKKGEEDLKSIVDEDHLEALERCARCGLKLSGRVKGSRAWGNKMLFPNKLFCSEECLNEELQELRDDIKRVNEFRN